MLNVAVDQRHTQFALMIAVAMAAVVGAALFFELVLGYLPCYLCLLQRTPYYIGVPVALFAALAGLLHWPSSVIRGFLIIVGLLMAYGAVLSSYHAGVEWGWWAGPSDCGAASTSGVVTDVTNLLADIEKVQPPACEDPALRVLGLSFAGWNILVSVGLVLWTVFVLRLPMPGKSAA